MNDWVYVADVDKIAAEQLMTFCVQGEELLVYHTGDRYYIYANRCPHQEVPLADGYLVKGTIICRLHGAKFDLQTGVCLRSPASANLHVYTAEVREGQLYVNLTSFRQEAIEHQPAPMTFCSRKEASAEAPTFA